jgi:hypothetical protein
LFQNYTIRDLLNLVKTASVGMRIALPSRAMREKIASISPTLRQILKQSFGFLQIGRREAFGQLRISAAQQLSSLICLGLLTP